MILAEIPAGRTRSLLPPGRSAAEWHAALSAEIAQHLTPAHAAILAAPSASAAGEQWDAPTTRAVRSPELPAADRDALLRAVQVILSDIRRLAESGSAPAVAACWPALREIPDLGMLFAADGRPVLAGWACVPAAAAAPRGLLASMDDGHAWRARPRTPWRIWGFAGVTLAVLALALGLVATWFALPRTTVAACMVAPAELAALDGQAQGDARHNALMAELARLVDQQGRARLQCPIPQAPPLRTHAEAPPGPALPLDRWQQHDLAMFRGCWTRVSSMSIHDEATDKILPVASWRLCFDDQGNGTQTLTLENGGHCTGQVHAAFAGDSMVTTAGRCTGAGFGAGFRRTEQNCTRVTDDEAHCIGRDLEGPNLNHGTTESVFRR